MAPAIAPWSSQAALQTPPAQATTQTMNRFLNRLPTITIREGHRVKVYLTNDLELPAYALPAIADRCANRRR